jgi:hypothetical protein
MLGIKAKATNREAFPEIAHYQALSLLHFVIL